MMLWPARLLVLATIAVLACTGFAQAQPQPAQQSQQEPVKKPAPTKTEASPETGFHQPYLLVLPEEIRPGASIIVALPTPQTSENPAEYLAAAERMAVNAGPFLAQLKAPILVPVLPRPPVQVEGGYINLYIPALSRAALEAREPALARMDKQVLAMVDDARRRVKQERDVETNEKAIFTGFSAGGHFATRMAVLHPKRVLAAWSGGTGGHPILPVTELEGKQLTYPLGVADLEAVSGEPFDAEAFATVPILIVQGGADTNISAGRDGKPSDSYSSEQASIIFEVLGETAVERLEKVKQAYAAVGSKAQFRVYPEAAHQMTPEIVADMIRFIEEHMPADDAPPAE